MIRIGKAASVFGRLVNIWKSKNISLAVKIRLYESLIISTHNCGCHVALNTTPSRCEIYLYTARRNETEIKSTKQRETQEVDRLCSYSGNTAGAWKYNIDTGIRFI